MNDINANDLEVVGFNGTPAVACGRALPVARRATDGMYCVLRLGEERGPLAWYGAEEAENYRANRQWTMFVRAVPVPGSCRDETREHLVRQPMVLYTEEAVLDTAGRTARPPLASGEYLIWRDLEGYAENVQAACAAEGTVEKVLNEWGGALIERFDAMYRLGSEREYLKRIADFGLCAAKDRSLRWKCYLRYATSQEPDHVRRTFDTFTHREFPDVPWEAFVEQLRSLGDVLGAVPARPAPTAPTRSQPSTARPKIWNIAAEKPIAMTS